MQSNKKIAIISDFVYPIVGGTEKYVFESANYFSKTNKVRIISPVWTLTKEKENFSYKRFSKNLDIIKFKGRLRRNKFVKPVKFLINLIRFCRDYEIIHGHYYSNALVAILFAKLFNKKSVIMLYEVENLMNRKYLKLLNKADKILVISNSLKNYVEQRGLKNVEVVTPWINFDSKRFNQNKLKRKYGLTNKKVILFIGRIIKTKGVGLLIKAIPIIKNKFKNFKVIFIGSKIDKELINLPKKLKVADYCEFKGFVSEKEKEDYCKLCDISIYPPYVKGGFGFVLLETMKYGKAVIGSDNWGVPDAVGDAGIIIPQKSVSAISKSLINLLTDDKLRKNYGVLAKERAKEFDKDMILKRYKRLLLN